MSTSNEPPAASDHASSEARERQAARRRARDAVEGGAGGGRRGPDPLAGQAFTALADNVREYAVFLPDPTGVICYWGEGARLMKWWTRAEAEGSRLRLSTRTAARKTAPPRRTSRRRPRPGSTLARASASVATGRPSGPASP